MRTLAPSLRTRRHVGVSVSVWIYSMNIVRRRRGVGVAEVGLGCERPTRDGSGGARCLSAKRHVVHAALAKIWGVGGGGVGPGYDWKRSCALCGAGDRTNDARVVAKQKPPPITFTFP